MIRNQVIGETRDQRLVCEASAEFIWDLAVQCRGVAGHAVEFGVYRGGTAKIIAKALPEKIVLLYDTFTGIPTATPQPGEHQPGEFGDTSIESVRAYLADCPNVLFRQGFFPDSAKSDDAMQWAFVHLDADLYASTAAALDFFLPRMSPGSFIILDDYDWHKCPGVTRAIKEKMSSVYVARRGPHGTDQAWWHKES